MKKSKEESVDQHLKIILQAPEEVVEKLGDISRKEAERIRGESS